MGAAQAAFSISPALDYSSAEALKVDDARQGSRNDSPARQSGSARYGRGDATSNGWLSARSSPLKALMNNELRLTTPAVVLEACAKLRHVLVVGLQQVVSRVRTK
jgi:hypothetical protein